MIRMDFCCLRKHLYLHEYYALCSRLVRMRISFYDLFSSNCRFLMLQFVDICLNCLKKSVHLTHLINTPKIPPTPSRIMLYHFLFITLHRACTHLVGAQGKVSRQDPFLLHVSVHPAPLLPLSQRSYRSFQQVTM